MNILLHICCANCAAYPVKTLRQEEHKLTGFWFNPNIQPDDEYALRFGSVKKLADLWSIDMLYNEHEPEDPVRKLGGDSKTRTRNFFTPSKGRDFLSNGVKFLEPTEPDSVPQRPRNRVDPTKRCRLCYGLRLEKTAVEASGRGFDAFSTTLLISPYQDFEQICAVGDELAGKYGISFYLKDFRSYFRRSLATAKELGIYRQKYCGCIFSREERYQEKIKTVKSRV